jgi:hypothetical protein
VLKNRRVMVTLTSIELEARRSMCMSAAHQVQQQLLSVVRRSWTLTFSTRPASPAEAGKLSKAVAKHVLHQKTGVCAHLEIRGV